MRQTICFALLCCLVLSFTTGCSHAPRITYYSFESTAKPAAVTPQSAVAKRERPSVSIESVTVPELVDRLQLVQRVNAARIDILEFHRWAEPLKSGISRRLADNLSLALGSDRVSIYPQSVDRDPESRVFVDFHCFEFDGSTVTVDAQWGIRSRHDGRLREGRVQSRLPTGTEGYEAAVTAFGRALAVVSDAISRSLQSEWDASSGQKK
jgi:uncharacterized lipoprotein YmbA